MGEDRKGGGGERRRKRGRPGEEGEAAVRVDEGREQVGMDGRVEREKRVASLFPQSTFYSPLPLSGHTHTQIHMLHHNAHTNTPGCRKGGAKALLSLSLMKSSILIEHQALKFM